MSYLHFAHQLSDMASSIALRYFRAPLSVKHKADKSPVTIADEEIEHTLRQHILNHYPNHAIYGEETGAFGESAHQWIIDPIDGTKSFLSGFPTFATLIAYYHNHIPQLSLIDMPALKQRFVATPTQATLNNAPIATRQTSQLSQAILYSTEPGMFDAEQSIKRQRLAQQCQLSRYNGDAYLYAMLAAGWIDLVVEADLKAHDYLPLILLVEQAGGVISDWQGQALNWQSKGEVLASANPILHQAALTELNR